MIEIRDETDFNNWFKKNYKKIGFSKLIRYNPKGFPDFIMESKGKKIRIELEIKSSNFILHKHPVNKVDKVICIKKDVNLRVPIIELKKFKLVRFDKDVTNSIKHQIYKLIKKKKIVTSSELAKFLKISWNTADKYLLELVVDGKIIRIKKEGVNLWMLK
ncbi:MAG: hypothetical protein AABX30_03300 [Nanoarchaeota archaeon]